MGYILKIDDLYLAPRPSIHVVEPDDFKVTTGDQECGCSLITEREFRFVLWINGRGSLATAYAMKARIDAKLNLACAGGGPLFTRTLHDYTLSFTIKNGYTHEIETRYQMGCDAMLVLEMIIKLIDTPAQISPFIVNVTPMTPSYTTTHGPSPSPYAVVATPVTPSTTTLIGVSPKTVSVTEVTPTYTVV